jgi:dipeptidyl aminopeptidase/acylaminoacyl peptidase
MSPRNDLLDHAMNLFPPPERALEQVRRRHGRRQRNRRLGAALLGLAIAIGLILGTTGVLRSSQRPAHGGPTGPQPPRAAPTIAFTAWKVPGGDPDHEQVYVARPDGSITQITHGASHRTVTWSPDGSQLIVLRGISEIWAIAADGSSPVRLAVVGPNRFRSADVHVHFSPDGSMIAYQRDRDLFVMDADGSDQTRIASRLDELPGYADFSWSPDGSRIVFATGGRRGIGGLFTVHPDGTGLEPLGTGALEGAAHPSWSPDGSTIAFSGYRPGSYGDNVFAMDLDGGAPIQVAKGHSPTWSPDGSQIAVEKNGLSILVISRDGSQKASLPGCASAGIDWSPEGAQLVMVGTLPEGGGRCRGIFIEDTPISDSGPLERTNVARLPAPAMIYLPRWQPSN